MYTPRKRLSKGREDDQASQRATEPADTAELAPAEQASAHLPGPGAANSLSPASIVNLQRLVGNTAVVQLLKDRAAGQPAINRSLEEEEDLADAECPGGKIRSEGQGRGEGTGGGSGPIGRPKDEEW